MGISKAKGMAIANRLAGTPRRIFVLTGDGELQEGQFWESLASAAHHAARRDRGDHRSQQDSVGHLGGAGQRPGRPRRQAARLRLARQPLRRSRRRGHRADAPRARRRHRSSEGHRRRHGEGQGRLLHGRSGHEGRRVVRLPLGRADRIGIRARLQGAARERGAGSSGTRALDRSRRKPAAAPSAASRVSPTT